MIEIKIQVKIVNSFKYYLANNSMEVDMTKLKNDY